MGNDENDIHPNDNIYEINKEFQQNNQPENIINNNDEENISECNSDINLPKGVLLWEELSYSEEYEKENYKRKEIPNTLDEIFKSSSIPYPPIPTYKEINIPKIQIPHDLSSISNSKYYKATRLEKKVDPKTGRPIVKKVILSMPPEYFPIHTSNCEDKSYIKECNKEYFTNRSFNNKKKYNFGQNIKVPNIKGAMLKNEE